MHAHFDCFSGISGDMVLGVFVDMGISVQWLADQMARLSIGDIEIVSREVRKNGIGAKRIEVIETSPAPIRNYNDIRCLIENGPFAPSVKNAAVDIFDRIADAEAKVHQCPKEKVHFHEVGAVDSIVDIVGAALCFDHFNITSASSSPLPLGNGFVQTRHGRLPVPAPATAEILKGLPVYGSAVDGELVTPTGAAIIATMVQEFGSIPDMKISDIGYGSGSRDFTEMPNLLRVFVGEKKTGATLREEVDVCVVECNIDDMSPEVFGYLMDRLFVEGALDVSYTAVMMKKNRPGTKIEVMCPMEKRSTITRCLFDETSTIGLRYRNVHRLTLPRSIENVTTDLGIVQVKCIVDPDGNSRYTPEYHACKKAAQESGLALRLVYEKVNDAISRGHIIGKEELANRDKKETQRIQ